MPMVCVITEYAALIKGATEINWNLHQALFAQVPAGPAWLDILIDKQGVDTDPTVLRRLAQQIIPTQRGSDTSIATIIGRLNYAKHSAILAGTAIR